MLIRELEAGAHNFTVLVAEVASAGGGLELALPGDDDVDGAPGEPPYGQTDAAADDYERIMADVWVGAVLTLLIFSCICCVCSCLLYHKFRQWKTRVQARSLAEAASAVGRGAAAAAPGAEAVAPAGELESLPSYTIVSGLPSYDEALDQLRRTRLQLTQPDQPAKLSAEELFATYKVYQVS
ncbi:protein commissureless 2 homolog isoform X2 [Schistocerca gregaria]|uniref:protein commissureless 2 homolog isoform X2 n=1 Tax=Schistocerca gregaria TaxID=7010 RepID=UPI00211EAC9A|nr:protein commissureless 2 homolog isoform X2 [Schistocerca gregaria]